MIKATLEREEIKKTEIKQILKKEIETVKITAEDIGDKNAAGFCLYI